MSSSVSIVTVTYNAKDFIERFLISVKALLEVDHRFSLVIIDNDSNDDTVELCNDFVTEHGFKERIHVVATNKNAGFGAGCNAGAAVQPDSEYLWFLNPDTTIEPASGIELLKFLEDNADVTAAGSVLKNERDEERPGAFRFPTIATSALDAISLGVLDRTFSSKTVTYQDLSAEDNVDWLTGASFMMRRDIFDRHKGFDQKYFLYFEEVDLFLRLRRSGHQFRCVLSSVIFHESGASTGTNRQNQSGLLPRKPGYWLESRRRFYIKNYGHFYLVIHDIVFVGASLLGRLKSLITGKKKAHEDHFLRDIIRYSGWH